MNGMIKIHFLKNYFFTSQEASENHRKNDKNNKNLFKVIIAQKSIKKVIILFGTLVKNNMESAWG